MSNRIDPYERREEQHRRRHEAAVNRIKYKKEISELKRRSQREQYKIKQEMFAEISRLRPDNRHYQRHAREVDFERYYARLKYARPIGIIFIVALWGLLFLLGGFSTGVGIVFSIFAGFTTLGYIFQTISFNGMEKRVLKPVANLMKGVGEITQGNYEVKVDVEGTWEVQSLIKNFNAMAEKLKENEEMKAEYEENRKQLIASISHDLKTPITSVIGYIEGIFDDSDMTPEKLDKYLKIIRGNSVYMNKLIDDLFLFSKLDMQKLTFEFADTAVSPLLADMTEELKLDAHEKGASLKYTDETDGTLRASLDAKRFNQVIRNIVDNACKYGEKELNIDVMLKADGDNISISIANNGPVIPQEQLTHIFDRFYRLDAARTKDISSTGLGLAIAKELVEAHGGRISAESEQGLTSFTITLPRSKEN